MPAELLNADSEIRRQCSAEVDAGEVISDEPYNAIAVLARILVDRTSPLPSPAFFAALERCLVTADSAHRNLLIVGLIEDVQNALLNTGRDLESWEPHLGPDSLRAWSAVAIQQSAITFYGPLPNLIGRSTDPRRRSRCESGARDDSGPRSTKPRCQDQRRPGSRDGASDAVQMASREVDGPMGSGPLDHPT